MDTYVNVFENCTFCFKETILRIMHWDNDENAIYFILYIYYTLFILMPRNIMFLFNNFKMSFYFV